MAAFSNAKEVIDAITRLQEAVAQLQAKIKAMEKIIAKLQRTELDSWLSGENDEDNEE